MRLLLITGLPGTGKTTLARQLARHYGVALLSKDTIKEPLLDAFGAGDAAHSRKLSDISFAVLFSLARELLAAQADVILEGNFRSGEHEEELRKLAPARTAQILCSIDEAERSARLAARQHDRSRHAGHRHLQRSGAADAAKNQFVNLTGQRFEFSSAQAPACLISELDQWWHAI